MPSPNKSSPRRATDDWDYIEAQDQPQDTAAPLAFGHTLALALGCANVAELLSRLSCSQFDGWWQHYRRAPWGWHIENFRAGQLCSVIFNSTGRASRPAKPSDFYPKLH